MKVLLINGSPHAKGCTYTALSEVEKTLNKEGIDTEWVQVGVKPVAGCIACGACGRNADHKCAFTDDAVNEAVDKMKECDGMIVGSPVHYAAASGAVTSFMDRLFMTASKSGILKLKPGAVVVSCRRGGASAAFDQLNKYFTISEMPIAASSYWNQVHGNTPDEVKQDLEGLRTMRVLAKNMAYLLKCQDIAKKQGLNIPEVEPAVKTNFIR